MTEPASFWSHTAILSAVKRTIFAMALLLTSVFGVTGCGSDDGEAPVESRIKNSGLSNSYSSRIKSPEELGVSDNGKIKYLVRETQDLMSYVDVLEGESSWTHDVPLGNGGLQEKSLLNANHHLGFDTVGCSLINANRGLRSEPPTPQVNVSPWLQTTISPDLMRRPLGLDCDLNDDLNGG